MDNEILIEACVNSTASAMQAQKGGAGRVELCENLHDGGVTPSYGSIKAARKYLEIILNVIIRPRGGDFVYSPLEMEIMEDDIRMCKELGVDGVVIGVLNPDGSINREHMERLIALARPMSVTCHRAFDRSRDPFEALETLIELGVDRILTSGQQASAEKGAELLTQLVEKAEDRMIVIMPGVDINAANIASLIQKTGACEFHVLADKKVESSMTFRNTKAYMGDDPNRQEYEIAITDWEQIRDICKAAGAI